MAASVPAAVAPPFDALTALAAEASRRRPVYARPRHHYHILVAIAAFVLSVLAAATVGWFVAGPDGAALPLATAPASRTTPRSPSTSRAPQMAAARPSAPAGGSRDANGPSTTPAENPDDTARPGDATASHVAPRAAPLVPEFSQVIYPLVGGNAMALIQDHRRRQTVELWSLVPRRRRATLRLAAEADSFALSPNGQWLVCLGGSPRTARVLAFRTGDVVSTFKAGSPRMHQVLGFAGNDGLLLRRWTPLGTQLEIRDPKTGTIRHTAPMGSCSGQALAVSPDASRLAVILDRAETPAVAIYDLNAGRLHVREPLADAEGGSDFRAGGLAYRGDRLAALVSVDARWRIAVLHARTGETLEQFDVSLGGATPIDRPPGGGRVFDWIDEGQWLAFGQVVVNRSGHSRRVYASRPQSQFMLPDGNCQLVTGTRDLAALPRINPRRGAAPSPR
ncbi:MAG: hypothetical protein KGY99_05890 [Phycisphaerae bacterium]|nr:hypothetical protein [Phycisphaerae bacterium]